MGNFPDEIPRGRLHLAPDDVSPDFVVAFCGVATVNVRLADTTMRKNAMISRVMSFLAVLHENVLPLRDRKDIFPTYINVLLSTNQNEIIIIGPPCEWILNRPSVMKCTQS